MKKRFLSLLLVIVMVLGMLPVSAFAADVPFSVTADGEAAALSYVGDFADRQYGFSQIPVYLAQVSESAAISVPYESGYRTFSSNYFSEADLVDMTKETLVPYFTTAGNYGLTTENNVAYVELRDSDYNSVYGVLIELMPAESTAPELPFSVTADGEAAALSYVGDFADRQYGFSQIPVYLAQVSESAAISVPYDSGYRTFSSNYYTEADLVDMTKDTLAPYFTTAGNYGLTTENNVAYVELRDSDYNSVYGVLIELMPASDSGDSEGSDSEDGNTEGGITGVASSTNEEEGAVVSNAFDGDYNTYWATAAGGSLADAYLIADLGGTCTINKVAYTKRYDSGALYNCTGNLLNYVIEVSTDGEIWTKVAEGATNDGTTVIEFESVQAAYVRLTSTSSYHWDSAQANTVMCVAELAIYEAEAGETDPDEPETAAVTLTSGDGYTLEAANGSESPVEKGGSYSFTVTVADGYDGTNMVVKANDTVLTVADGVYTITNIQEDQTVTVTGVEQAAIFDGTGTAEDPYLIQSAEDLVTLSQKVAAGTSFSGEYFLMTADITLPADWTPLGVDKKAPFSGNFDGGDHLLTVPEGGLPLIGTPVGASLSNLNIYGTKIAGYGVVNNYCEIGKKHAITIENVTLKSGTQTLQSGFIGGYASGSDTVTIRNCTVEEGVVIGYDRAQTWVGSFAGEFNGTIENCVSYATVYGTDFVGGIVANKGQSMGTFTISDCQFHGDVIATGNYVGGIVGHGYGGTMWGFTNNSGIPTITNCTVTGSVTGGDYVGGIYGGDVAVVQVWDNVAGSVTGNSFTGTVSATDGEYVGAVIGYLKSLNKNNIISDNTYSADCGASKGIGFVMYVDTSCETHETESGAFYFNTAEGKPGITGVTKTDHNRTDDPLGADAEKLCRAESTAVIPVELKTSGTYKTAYTTGEALDLSGIILTVVYSDGSEKTIALADAAVTGYDSAKVGEQKLTISCDGLAAFVTVTVKNADSKVSVTVSVFGDSVHDSDTDGKVHTLAAGNLTTWVNKQSVVLEGSTTAWDAIQAALDKAGISYEYSWNSVYDSYYVESVNGLGEFTNGERSGWLCKVNGASISVGVSAYQLKEGDVVVFHYTDDYAKEDGSQGDGDENTDSEAAEAAEKLIDAIGTVTLNSSAKITAARKAYDALSYAQKQLVENYTKLTAAETKFAQLVAADNEKKASAVETQINAIKEGSSTFEEDVLTAQKAYNALTYAQKQLVDNYKKLAGYLKDLADEEDKEAAEAVEKLIEKLDTITLDSEKDIQKAREAYEALTDEQKALVENLADLEAAEKKLAELKSLAGVEDIYKSTGDYLEELGTPYPGSTGGEWMVIGLSRSDREVPGVDDYYDSVVKYVQENIDENQRLHTAKSTENSRLILALTVLGEDVTNVDGHNLLDGLNDMAYVQKQGINGPIWALLAFDSGNYPTPAGDVTRETLVKTILDAQLPDGGWALSGEISSADITGMAVQALAPYGESDANVKKALEEAVEAMSGMQTANGSFGSTDGASSESIAQVITALSALGIDAHKDERFVKDGISAVDALCAYYVEGGGFKHLMDGGLDGMATEQGYYALTAYFRMRDGKTNLFNMTDVVDLGGGVTGEAEPTETVETEPAEVEETGAGFPWWILILLLAAVVLVVVVVNRKKLLK